MSQLVIVRIREGVFVSRNCLEEALEEVGLDFITIVQNKQDNYSLELSKADISSRQKDSVKSNLEDTMESILEKVHPVYARILAIQNITEKGFKERKRTRTEKGEKVVMEREKALKDGGGFERIEITIHNDNTVTLDHHNFVGRNCIRVSEKLVKQLGKVQKRKMKPEARTRLKAKSKNQRRLRL
jgi:hypothetical protein